MPRTRVPAHGFGREQAQALAGLIALFVITAAWWALALWPADAAPAWLARTRYVCFGVNETGLPDAGGWIGLIAGPLGMFGILIIGWREGLFRLIRHTRRSRALAATFAILAVGVAALVTGAVARVQQARASTVAVERASERELATFQKLDRDAPPLVLTSQTGAILDITTLKGKPVLVTFAYAHCATVCPLIVTQSLKAQAPLRGSGDEPAVLIVTLDPWRDTPSRLPTMAASWQLPAEHAYVLSGSVEQVETVLDQWQVPRSRDLTTGSITHPPLVYVLDREGHIAYAATGGVDAIVNLIRRL